jgi:hypothetical protein
LEQCCTSEQTKSGNRKPNENKYLEPHT